MVLFLADKRSQLVPFFKNQVSKNLLILWRCLGTVVTPFLFWTEKEWTKWKKNTKIKNYFKHWKSRWDIVVHLHSQVFKMMLPISVCFAFQLICTTYESHNTIQLRMWGADIWGESGSKMHLCNQYMRMIQTLQSQNTSIRFSEQFAIAHRIRLSSNKFFDALFSRIAGGFHAIIH